MTFEKAYNAIQTEGRLHKNEFNQDSKRLVVPANPEDYEKYLTDYFLNKNIFTDDDAKRYSSNNEFNIGSFVI